MSEYQFNQRLAHFFYEKCAPAMMAFSERRHSAALQAVFDQDAEMIKNRWGSDV